MFRYTRRPAGTCTRSEPEEGIRGGMFDWLITLVGVLDSLPDAGRAMLSGAVLAGGLCYV